MKIIVNADDFGLCIGQNEGIKEAHLNGIVTSATLLVNGTAYDHACRLIRELPNLDIGIHLTLTLGKSLLPKESVQSLVDSNGTFRKHDLTKPLKVVKDEVYHEWNAQIAKAIQSNVTVTHLDSHHHVHLHPDLFPIACRIADEHDLPLRYVSDLYGELDRNHDKVMLIDCDTRFYMDHIKPDFFLDYKPPYPREVWEIMCHPAYVDDWLQKNSSYTTHREIELQTLTNPKTKVQLRESKIELTQHSSLEKRK